MRKIIEVEFVKNTENISANNKSNNFNMMRLVLSLCVVFSHSFELITLNAPVVLGRTLGNFVVHCFFALSGYFIITSWRKAPIASQYIIKRAFRLIPEFIIAFILSDCLASLCGNYSLCPTPFIKNGVVWTLYYEIIAYILILLLGILKLDNLNICGSLYVMLLMVMILFYNNANAIFTVVLPLLIVFVGGSIISFLEDTINIKKMGIVSVILLLIMQIFPGIFGTCLSYIPLIYGPDMSNADYYIFLVCLPFALIYCGKYLKINIVLHIDISYEIYIYAWPIQQAVIYCMLQKQMSLNPILVFGISALFTCLLSVFSHYFIGKPIAKVRQKILKKLK